jgi:hypothetical protein
VPVWVQLTKSKRLSPGGVHADYQPGDWVKVGKQLALQWIANGEAIAPFPDAIQVEEPEGTAGIMHNGDPGKLPSLGVPFDTYEGARFLRWDKTCFWDVSVPVRHALFAVGFSLLNTWQLAVPLWDYRVLARDDPDSTDQEKEITARAIRDLRVPMYDTRLIFARRCEEVRLLLEYWEAEGGVGRLAFLRALYRAKPLVCALPVTWTNQWAPETG